MTPKLGLIVRDTCQLDEAAQKAETTEVATDHGPVVVKLFEKWAVICRSGFEGDYLMPHEYDTLANLSAFKKLGIQEIIGVHSTGSLRPSLAPGMLMIPDDWINFNSQQTTTISGRRVHQTPSFSNRVRQNLAAAAWKAEIRFENGGTYWQTQGPRLETKAEIKFMSSFADLVGMGMATEATLAQELELEYAALCSVDNYAHGLGTPKLTDEMIHSQSMKNVGSVATVLAHYPE